MNQNSEKELKTELQSQASPAYAVTQRNEVNNLPSTVTINSNNVQSSSNIKNLMTAQNINSNPSLEATEDVKSKGTFQLTDDYLDELALKLQPKLTTFVEDIVKKHTKEAIAKSVSPERDLRVDYTRFVMKSRALGPNNERVSRDIKSAGSKRILSGQRRSLQKIEVQIDPTIDAKKAAYNDTMSLNSLNDVGSELCSEETNAKIESKPLPVASLEPDSMASKMSLDQRKAIIKKMRKENHTIFQEHRKIKSQELLFEDRLRNSLQAKLALEQLIKTESGVASNTNTLNSPKIDVNMTIKDFLQMNKDTGENILSE